MKIYHIVLPKTLERIQGIESYAPESLADEGFVHCSFEDQVDTVLARYFNAYDEVAILEIDPEILTSKVVAEPSTDDEIYPHVYGEINTRAITGTEIRKIAAKGQTA